MGEIYCLVCTSDEIKSHLCSVDCSDCEYRETGKCFKIAAEDGDAVERVKDLLLHLREPVTECTQLPKLTTEVFERLDCPEWAEYAAVDKNGKAYYFTNKPKCYSEGYFRDLGWDAGDFMLIGDFDSTDWRNSLIKRHAKLPDWCKVD